MIYGTISVLLNSYQSDLVPLLWEEQLLFCYASYIVPSISQQERFSPKDIFPPSPRESLKFPSSIEQTEQSGKRRRIWCPFSNLSLNPSAKVAGFFEFWWSREGSGKFNSISTSQWWCYEGNPCGVVDMMFDLCTFSITSISKYLLETSSINLKSARCRWCHPWHLFLDHRAERRFHWPSPKNWEVTYPTYEEKSSFPTFLRGYVIVPWRFMFH